MCRLLNMACIFMICAWFSAWFGGCYEIHNRNHLSGNFVDSDKEQKEAIEKKLKPYRLGPLKQACSNCDFELKEAISRNVSGIDEQKTSLLHSQSGVYVYIFENLSIEKAFASLLDSNIFDSRINRKYKDDLIKAIAGGKKNFEVKKGLNDGGIVTQDVIGFTKRLWNKDEPKVILNSISTFQNNAREYRYSDTLEGYIVGGEIIILHFYTESKVWKK